MLRPCRRCRLRPANRGHTQCSQCRYEIRMGRAVPEAQPESHGIDVDDLVDTLLRLDETVTPAMLEFPNGARIEAPPGLLTHYHFQTSGRRFVWKILVKVESYEQPVARPISA